MPFNINDFLKNTNENLMRETQFDIEIQLPPGVKGDTRMFTFLCSAANIPQRQIDLTSVKRYGYGLDSYFGISHKFSQLDLSFYCDNNSEIIKCMNDWMDSVMEIRSRDPGARYGVNYSDIYDSTITLRQYRPDGNEVAEYQFYNAWPTSFGPVNYNWSGKDQLLIIPVSFVYVVYEIFQKNTINNKGGEPPTNNKPTNQLQTSKNTTLPGTGSITN